MKAKMLRSLTLTLVLVMALSMFGCTKKTTETPTASDNGNDTKAATSSTTAQVPETEIKWCNNYNVKEGSTVQKKLEEQFNVKITPISLTWENYAEQYQLMATTNDLPDIFTIWGAPMYTKFAKEGVLKEISMDALSSKAPGIVENINKFDQKMWGLTNVEGKNYGIPVAWSIGHYHMSLAIREDWMKNVGITKDPETIQEMEDMFTKFVNEDPDKNNKKDTYAISAPAVNADFLQSISYVFGAYGYFPNMNIVRDGKIVRGEVQPEMKEALTTLNSWYKKKLIDPEFVTNTKDIFDQKWYNSKFGALSHGFYMFWPASWYFDGSYHDKLISVKQDASVKLIAPPKGPRGESGLFQNSGAGSFVVMGKQVDDAKQAKIFEILNAINNDAKLTSLVYVGEEGVTFNKKEIGVEMISPYDNAEKKDEYGANGYFSLIPNYDLYNPILGNAPEIEKVEKMNTGKWDALLDYPLQSYIDKSAILSEMVTSNYIKFITGERLLSEFDTFVKEWRAAGGDAVEQEANNVYNSKFK